MTQDQSAVTSRTSATALIDALVDLDVEYVFANLGTDHVSVIEELARREDVGLASPCVIICPHENVAAHMAAGFALATGRGQAVLVHVDAGTANAAMAMHNMFRTRVPVLLLAGRAPFSFGNVLPGGRDNYVHFVQDPFDIASLVRSYCKWEYDLPSGLLARAAAFRAHSIIHSDPMGPAFMTFARETLAAEFEEEAFAAAPAPRGPPLKASGLDPAMAERIADEIIASNNPIAITGYLGRNPDAARILGDWAAACGVRIFEFNPTHANISRDSPCYAGWMLPEAMEGVDLGLLLDVDVPFLPKSAPLASNIRWLQIDVDALKADLPMWGFDSDLRVQADCAEALAQVLQIVRGKTDEAFRARVTARIERFKGVAEARCAKLSATVKAAAGGQLLSSEEVCAALGRRLTASDILVNEAITNVAQVADHIPRSQPGTYFANGGGGLGFSGGVALGLKLAHPDRRIVQVVGDGVFHFCNPDCVYALAQRYDLPILTVVLDNGGWKAVKSAVQRVYPAGASARSDNFHSRLSDGRSGEQRQFSQVCQAFGGHGEHVGDRSDLEGAIERCLEAVSGGQAAVLHVDIAPL
jgi:acetolactate synthase-1/2/3 large subunit